MINPIGHLEVLEKQSKTSSGIMMVLGYTMLGIGFLFVYASTIDIIIKDKVSFGIGGAMVIMSMFVLIVVYKDKYEQEKLLRLQKLHSDAIQSLKDFLDFQMKLTEYNEKAIAYNEKNKNPKMDILNYSDLRDMIKDYYDSLFPKKS